MATIIAAEPYPAVLEREQGLLWKPDFMNDASPKTISGLRQVFNKNGGGLWRARFDNVVINRSSFILAWRAAEVTFAGGLTPVDVPQLLCGLQPFPLLASGRPDFASAITVTVVGDTDARAVALRLAITLAGEIKAGQDFSVYNGVQYGWRMHRIKTVAAVGGHTDQRDITFWPPLRFALSNSDPLEFKAPRCVMQLDESASMDMPLELRQRGSPSAGFVECE